MEERLVCLISQSQAKAWEDLASTLNNSWTWTLQWGHSRTKISGQRKSSTKACHFSIKPPLRQIPCLLVAVTKINLNNLRA